MNGLITPTKDQIRYRNAATSFWSMTIIAIAIFFSYVHETNEVSDKNKEIAQLQTDKDLLTVQLAAKDLLIKQYQERFSSVQTEIEQVERKRAEDAKKAAAKKAHADFVRDEVVCLADNIYREAAYEPENGQLAVATVTMNRVADPFYPKTVCGVVYERHIKKDSDKIVCMFSWTCKPKVTIHPSIYQRVLSMARDVYFKHERNDDVADATLYHASYIKYPNWADPDNLVATIGQHLFYKQ
jgi:N-acetylmuramoyl-L-alanine amidase